MKLRYALIASILLVPLLVGYAFYGRAKSNSDEKPMVIVITSYNNRDWYKPNLDSVFSQDYHNFRVVYIDDVSTDGTGRLVAEYIKEKGKEDLVQLIINKERIGQLGNIHQAVQPCDKNEVIVSLDGDDWFPNGNVLSHLNKTYSDPNVWLTYGQFIMFPSNTLGFATPIPQNVIEHNGIRNYSGVGPTHLRTFYAGLFQKIKKEDMLYEGKFYTVAGDVAFMTPMCEMAGTHIKFIPEILYVYNRSNPISDDRIHREKQVFFDRYIRKKEKYSPIEHF